MARPANRNEALKRWSEIIDDLEQDKTRLQSEIQSLEAEKVQLNRRVNLAKSKADKIDELVSGAQDALKNADDAKKLINESKEKIDGISATAEKLEQRTETIQDKSQENNATIEALLDLADKGALSGDFNAYARSYRKRADLYVGGIIFSIAAFITILLAFHLLDLPKNPTGLEILAYAIRKIAIGLPFAYLVYLFTGMQREARNLERLYRFKTAVALSLKANKELISELYGKTYMVKLEDKPTYPVAEFTKEVVKDNLYRIPDEGALGGNLSEVDGIDLSYFATKQTRRAINLLKEFSEIIKNVKA